MTPVPRPGRTGREAYAPEHLMLAERMRDECAGAVDSLEIAAALESDGMSDETAAACYGCADVFDLAERLYGMTARRPAPTPPPADRWRTSPPRHLLRGVAFGLPGLCYAAVAPAVAQPVAGQSATVAVLLLSLLGSWGGGQALAYLAYVRLGGGDHRGAARVVRLGGAGCAAIMVSATGCAAAALGTGPAVTALAVAQSLYLFAATASLLPIPGITDSGGEGLLLCALAPGVLASACYLLAGGGAPVPRYVWICCGLTVALTVGLAGWRTGRLGRAGAQAAAPVKLPATTLTLRQIGASLPYAAFGVLAGLLLTFTAVAATAGRGGTGPAALASAATTIAPLSFSMGVAEWLLLAYRRRAYLLLHRAPSIAAFGAAARRALGLTLTGYLAALAGLTAACGWLLGPAGTPLPPAPPAPPVLRGSGPPALMTTLTPAPLRPAHVAAMYPVSGSGTLLLHAAYLALGGALYVGLVLQSCGRSAAPLCLAAVALAVEAAVTWAGSPAWDAAALPAIQLICYGSLLAVLSVVACTALSKVARHV